MRLPFEEEDFQKALASLPMHPALAYAVRNIASSPAVDSLLSDDHLYRLFAETQTHGFWRVRGADGFVRPMLGCKPGTVLATDVFNLGFAPLIVKIQHLFSEAELGWAPPAETPRVFASE
eukprot:6648291-Pyramimonas_sp.AAC.1